MQPINFLPFILERKFLGCCCSCTTSAQCFPVMDLSAAQNTTMLLCRQCFFSLCRKHCARKSTRETSLMLYNCNNNRKKSPVDFELNCMAADTTRNFYYGCVRKHQKQYVCHDQEQDSEGPLDQGLRSKGPCIGFRQWQLLYRYLPYGRPPLEHRGGFLFRFQIAVVAIGIL